MRTEQDIWAYRSDDALGIDPMGGTDITGFGVEAIDGSIGKIDNATYDVGSSSIVVDTGPWIFGRKVMLPAGVIERVDVRDEKVYVNRTKDQIKDSPEYDDDRFGDVEYRESLGRYYGSGAGYRDWGV